MAVLQVRRWSDGGGEEDGRGRKGSDDVTSAERVRRKSERKRGFEEQAKDIRSDSLSDVFEGVLVRQAALLVDKACKD